jgi:hypothetical protein
MDVVRTKMARWRLARMMLKAKQVQEMRRMRSRFSPQVNVSEQSNELVALKQDSSLELAARFLELKRLRHQLRVAQCGRVTRWDKRSLLEKSPKRRRCE